jgi:hypothetical protein
MRTMKRVALGLSALVLLGGTSFAQGWRWQDRDHDRNNGYYGGQDQNDKWYQNGLRDGQNDRAHNRRAHPRHDDNRAYMNGYRAGYGQYGARRNDRDADDAYGRGGRGPYGNGGYGQNAQQTGYNNGYQEGMRYGLADRNNGHSYRPTYSDTYKHGSAGYTSAYGDKGLYKSGFQQGYRAGYDRGYNGGGYGRR